MPLNTRAFSTVSTEFPASPFASTVGTGGCAPDSHKFPTKECNPMRVQGADTTRHRLYIEMVFLLLFVTVAVVVTVAIYLFRWQVYFLCFFSSPTLVFLQVSRSMVATRFLLNKLKLKSLGCRRWKNKKTWEMYSSWRGEESKIRIELPWRMIFFCYFDFMST